MCTGCYLAQRLSVYYFEKEACSTVIFQTPVITNAIICISKLNLNELSLSKMKPKCKISFLLYFLNCTYTLRKLINSALFLNTRPFLHLSHSKKIFPLISHTSCLSDHLDPKVLLFNIGLSLAAYVTLIKQ